MGVEKIILGSLTAAPRQPRTLETFVSGGLKMQAAAKLTVSITDLSPVPDRENQPEPVPKCALRSALWSLMNRTAVGSDNPNGINSETGEANADLYSLMKNCAFFNGGRCGCSAVPLKSSVRVIYQSRQQL